MAKLVFKDCSIVLNAIDLSDKVESVTINYTVDTPEDTAMGAGTHSRQPGLLDWTIEINFRQDFAAANVDATLFPLLGATAFVTVIKPTSAGVSATNPSYTGTGLLSSYSPIGGSVGDIAAAPITIVAGGTALARSESP